MEKFGIVCLVEHCEELNSPGIAALFSGFIDKDSREQFEMRTHKRLIDIVGPTTKTIDALTQLQLPSGVEIDIRL